MAREVNDLDDYPMFKLGHSQFDQHTFRGRLRHLMNITDPRTLFTSDAKLKECVQLLDDYKSGKVAESITNKDLWEAQKIKQAIIHPDTGQKVFMPLRMSGYVVFGSPIVVGLLLPNLTIGQTVFWQWLNQSHNAGVNFANRNASKPCPTSRFVLGYTGAVTTAVSIAVGLTLLVGRAQRLSPAMRLIVQKFVPFPAVACASTCNVLLMRNSELSEGIEVFDSSDQAVGTSLIAAKKALQDTAMTRMILPAPILIIPPIIMTLLERTKFLQRNPRFHIIFNASVTTLSFAVALPVAIALFPQFSKIRTDELEQRIQESTPEETLYYNKGL